MSRANNDAKPVTLGVIGGSGFYGMSHLENLEEITCKTPYGNPSANVSKLKMKTKDGEKEFYFIPRHGKGHTLLPSEVNSRANIYAMKSLGVTHIAAISVVGIMSNGIHPGDMIIPDQIFDRTKGIRPSTFFGNGAVGHVEFSEPFCEEMRGLLNKACQLHHDHCLKESKKFNFHDRGTYVCMEGPQFSTRAESLFYRQSIGPDVIGMTALPEAKLAREAELSYGMLALATDYDCWNTYRGEVSVQEVLAVIKQNTEAAAQILGHVIENLPKTSQAPSLYAAQHALITNPEFLTDEVKQRLAFIYPDL